jgi:hemoglobin-like flavoprotein
MTTVQMQLIRETFPQLHEVAAPLAQLFYGRLFEIAPSVRPMFKSDIRVQGRKFTDMLEALVDGLEDFSQQEPALRAMGLRHVGYGVIPEHYSMLEAAFLWSLSQALGTSFSADVKAAWATLIEDVSTVMKAGASELPPS